MSSSAAKALSLLNLFSQKSPEIGLSELARLAKKDKATVYRMLVVLTKAGFVEQNLKNKRYRLGAGILRLSKIREACFPVNALLEPELHKLTELSGETAHASLFSGDTLGTIASSPSPKSNRVSLDAGELLGIHSTASGMAFLAFSDTSRVNTLLSGTLVAYTKTTETDPARIKQALITIKTQGYAEADQTYEDNVYGIATPLFDAFGLAMGTIAIATPQHRMTETLRATIIKQLQIASVKLTEALGGELPTALQLAYKKA